MVKGGPDQEPPKYAKRARQIAYPSIFLEAEMGCNPATYLARKMDTSRSKDAALSVLPRNQKLSRKVLLQVPDGDGESLFI